MVFLASPHFLTFPGLSPAHSHRLYYYSTLINLQNIDVDFLDLLQYCYMESLYYFSSRVICATVQGRQTYGKATLDGSTSIWFNGGCSYKT